MAAFSVASPLTTRVTLGSGEGLLAGRVPALARSSPSPSSRAAAPPPLRLQVTASKTIMGRVVTDTNDKSVTVEVKRIAVVPKYKKRIRTSKNYIVHDPENAARKGDTVYLARCAPVSKRKHLVVKEIKRAPVPSSDDEDSDDSS